MLATELSCVLSGVPVAEAPQRSWRSRAYITVRDGKMLSMDFFWDHAEALEAVGLRE